MILWDPQLQEYVSSPDPEVVELDKKFKGIDIQIRCLHEDVEDLKREVLALRKDIKAMGHVSFGFPANSE